MVSVALDATVATHPDPTGIGVYCNRLIQSLSKLLTEPPGSGYRIQLAFRPGPYVRRARKQEWPAGFPVVPLLDPWLGFRPRYPRAAIFHGLNQRLPRNRYPKQVVTIHDLFPLTSTHYSSPEFQRHFSRILHHAIRNADRILAVSETTREELLRHTDAREDQVRVVYHGVDKFTRPATAECALFFSRTLGLQPGEKFFLNIGAIQTRKNISNIVLALRSVKEYRLVLAGGDGHGAEKIHALIEREGMQDRVIRLGYTSPENLRMLYATARALVFPSLEEGFGFPVLEAMASCLPVITSNVSATREISGEAALLVNPASIRELTEAMQKIANDSVLAEKLREEGLKRASVFTWEKCARETLDAYGELD
jgi:glycosyltransferase involved in cell wall biosynthesis